MIPRSSLIARKTVISFHPTINSNSVSKSPENLCAFCRSATCVIFFRFQSFDFLKRKMKLSRCKFNFFYVCLFLAGNFFCAVLIVLDYFNGKTLFLVERKKIFPGIRQYNEARKKYEKLHFQINKLGINYDRIGHEVLDTFLREEGTEGGGFERGIWSASSYCFAWGSFITKNC